MSLASVRHALTLDSDARTTGPAALFIDGRFGPATAGATFPTVDPNTGRTIAEIPRADGTDVDRAVAAAKRVAVEWQFTDAIARAGLLRTLAGLVTEHADELARIEALDSGHYLSKAQDLVAAIPLWLEYWAGLADKVGGRTIEVPGNKLSFTLLEPLGVTAHIVPWNYPLLVMVRSIAPALALGNTVVVKPAEDTSLSACKFAELVQEAGFPDGVFNVVTGSAPRPERHWSRTRTSRASPSPAPPRPARPSRSWRPTTSPRSTWSSAGRARRWSSRMRTSTTPSSSPSRASARTPVRSASPEPGCSCMPTSGRSSSPSSPRG
ncbi:hypothetical protein PSA01_36230 [Pseudonocardia saturnea]|uniref:NAD/NADP-dependent betaine aldehyde dehydrogenase n=2 Tax=Pseudonocardia TaxID=1847 RepID=A0A1Y2MLW6_PSEAH|nr:NAD/NADP-dependent betaine aldehyde dehydrogenase [Pseudonocardia autotrophica]BBG03798.1 hypothetical protein Pdca_50070 [Pseudonocardia autotrophica]GEC26594.1 hypothetical protein PSA01_36230 [Pseudonocardia saturnea]